jgi:phosphoribosylanthranilate isomerase
MSTDFSPEKEVRPMAPTGTLVTQIYEIQTPAEAGAMLAMGVDHIGTVLVSEADWKQREIAETLSLVADGGGVSSLIPLYNTPETVFRTLDHYRPDLVHFCETVSLATRGGRAACERLLALQQAVRERFPQIQIMRSIPIAPPGMSDPDAMLALAALFEPFSDWFLTDTLFVDTLGKAIADQPVNGFVGITGETCDWGAAAQLVRASSIPVILAGGLSADNVFDGCLNVRPAGVDSCTRTNARDGKGIPIRFKKDPDRVRRFVAETRRAQTVIDGEGQPEG